MPTFYRTVKLSKEHLKETNENAALIEKQIQLNMDFKKWKMKNGLQIMTKMIIHYWRTEAIQVELERKIEIQKLQPFNNLTKGERAALQELSLNRNNIKKGAK